MQLHLLESFYHVCLVESFTLAAEQLNVSKGVLSRHVKQLEKDVDAQLLLRTTRSVKPTEAGQALFAHCQQIFQLTRDAQKAIQDVTEDAKGVLRFSCVMSLGEKLATALLPTFQQLLPDVQVELQLSNQRADILKGEQDIALRAVDTLEDDVVAKYLGQIRDVVIASPRLLNKLGLTEATLQHPSQLQQLPCLMNNHQTRWNQWQFTANNHQVALSHDVKSNSGHTQEQTINISGPIATNHYTAMRNLAIEAIGIAKLPYYLVEEDIAAGRLCRVLRDWTTSTHSLHIVHAKHTRLPKKLRVLKQMLIDWREQNPQYFYS